MHHCPSFMIPAIVWKEETGARTFRWYTSTCSIILWIMHARPFYVKLRCFECSLFTCIFGEKSKLNIKHSFLHASTNRFLLERILSFHNSVKRNPVTCLIWRGLHFVSRRRTDSLRVTFSFFQLNQITQ